MRGFEVDYTEAAMSRLAQVFEYLWKHKDDPGIGKVLSQELRAVRESSDSIDRLLKYAPTQAGRLHPRKANSLASQPEFRICTHGALSVVYRVHYQQRRVWVVDLDWHWDRN